jgi:hypothetical protein
MVRLQLTGIRSPGRALSAPSDRLSCAFAAEAASKRAGINSDVRIGSLRILNSVLLVPASAKGVYVLSLVVHARTGWKSRQVPRWSG